MQRLRFKAPEHFETAINHCVSRVVDRRREMGDEEKEYIASPFIRVPATGLRPPLGKCTCVAERYCLSLYALRRCLWFSLVIIL